MHEWHEKNNAVFVDAGVWLRPRYYKQGNETLFEASKTLKPILPIYVVENDYWKQPFSNRRHWYFIHDSLMELRNELKKIGDQAK